MVRYAKRVWYHPIAYMSAHLPSYQILCCVLALIIPYPFRNYFGAYYERMAGPLDIGMRQQAILFYNDLQDSETDTAKKHHPQNEKSTNLGARNAASFAEQLRMGETNAEFSYWRAHQADVQRAEALICEIKDLKAKIAREKSTEKLN